MLPISTRKQFVYWLKQIIEALKEHVLANAYLWKPTEVEISEVSVHTFTMSV